MKNMEIHTTSAHAGERNISRTRESGTLYRQFVGLTHNDPTFAKEIAMFTPELRDVCAWLESACGVWDGSGLKRVHLICYVQYLRQTEENSLDRLYVKAHRFAMELYCTVVYHAKLTPENYAARSRFSHGL